MAMLGVFATFLFRKRNVVSISRSSAAYCEAQACDLSRRAARYLPEVGGFLKTLSLSCQPEAFDRAVIRRIDVFTHGLFSTQDPIYFDLKSHFTDFGNCMSPLDLLFHGLFMHRARRNVAKMGRLALGVVAVLIIEVVLLVAR